MEYELLDTDVFNDDRYFDVFVEYAKNGPEDILVQITAVNRGPDPAELHIVPTLWFRNDWASWIAESNRASKKPILKQIKAATGTNAVAEYRIHCSAILSFPAKAMYRFYSPRTKQTTSSCFPGKKRKSLRQRRHQQGCRPATHRLSGATPGHAPSIHLLIRREQLPDLLSSSANPKQIPPFFGRSHHLYPA